MSTELFTRGKVFHTDMILPIVISETMSEDISIKDRFCLFLITEGSVVVQFNQQTLSLIGPACLCINQNDSARILSENRLQQIKIHFHPEIVNSFLTFDNVYNDLSLVQNLTARQDRYSLIPFVERDDEYKGFFQLHFSTFDRLKESIHACNNELTNQADMLWPCRGRSFFLEALFLINKVHRNATALPAMTVSEDSLVIRIVNYINNNYMEKITLDQLSKRFNTNRTTICKQFQETSGLTLVDYISKLRIQLACIFLRDTTLPVSELMYRVGFNDTAHFNRTFKKITDMTPGKYRDTFSFMV